MRLKEIAVCLLLGMAGMVHAQQSADGLQFNVPYLCNDGRTYVVHRCEKGPKFEACFYQTGQDSERYNTRDAVVYQMTKMCKVAPAASASASATTAPAQRPSDLNNSRWDCGNGASMTVFACQKQAGQDGCFVRLEQDRKTVVVAPKPLNEIQTHVSACKALPPFNPAYLAEFPNPYGVVQGMLVGKPQENAVRAIGAFYQLSEIIKVLAGSRALTPDEQKFLEDYSRVQAEMAQAALKASPGQRFDPASNPYRFARTDPRFGFEGIPVWIALLTPGTQSAFARMVGGNDGQYAVAVARERQSAFKQVQDEQKAQEAEASYAKDPGSVAVRHCVESGRSEVECLGEGLKVGMDDLTRGANPFSTKGILPQAPVGLRLTGSYAIGNFSLLFGQDDVIVGCGSLIPQHLGYTVQRSGMQISVTIPIKPKPVALSYKDGKLAGPGPMDVAGLVVIGNATTTSSTSYQLQNQTTTTQRQIDAGDVANYSADQVHQNGMEYSVDQQSTSSNWTPTTTHYTSVPTAPKTERCNVGMMQTTGETVHLSNALTDMLGSKTSKSANLAPGLRLNGAYAAQGGLKIEFRDDSATLECGESFNSQAYSVLPENGQFVVKFQNPAEPLSLILQPNGTLTGSGDVNVAGRRAIQGDGGKIDYLPRNARCAVSTLEAAK